MNETQLRLLADELFTEISIEEFEKEVVKFEVEDLD